MKQSVTVQIAVPEPCTQDWHDMQPVRGGRHCAHCQKSVVDFSRMTDTQLLAYFQKNNGEACGRFTVEQLDRAIKAVEIPRSTWWARVGAGLLLALGLSKNVNAQSKGSKEIIEQKAPDKEGQADTSASADSTGGYDIYGTLNDEKGNPIVNANVEVSKSGIVEGRDLTDFDGNYRIKPLGSGRYDVRFSYLGSEKIITGINVQGAKTKVCGALNTNAKFIGGAVIIRHERTRLIPEPPGRKTYKSGDNLPPGY